MAGPDQYFLGYRSAEQHRLRRQAVELADEAAWMFDRIGSIEGGRVVEIGCGPQGCLAELSRRVGPTGHVIGVERDEESVELARRFVKDLELDNVEVRLGDGRATDLPRAGFDLVTARLVLVNVPAPEQIVAEAAALTRPGGVVAFHETVWPVHTCDPPLAAWDRLYEILQQYAALNGIDLFVGRRLARLLREHGLVDMQVRPFVMAYPAGHGRRMLALDFVENLSGRLLGQGLIGADELDKLKAALQEHLEDPDTFVMSSLFIQAWARKPG